MKRLTKARSAWAQGRIDRLTGVLDQYVKECTDFKEPSYETIVWALLGDLRHLCEAKDVDLHRAMDESYVAYLRERAR